MEICAVRERVQKKKKILLFLYKPITLFIKTVYTLFYLQVYTLLFYSKKKARYFF